MFVGPVHFLVASDKIFMGRDFALEYNQQKSSYSAILKSTSVFTHESISTLLYCVLYCTVYLKPWTNRLVMSVSVRTKTTGFQSA